MEFSGEIFALYSEKLLAFFTVKFLPFMALKTPLKLFYILSQLNTVL